MFPLTDYLTGVYTYLSDFALSYLFWANFETVYGTEYDFAKVEVIRSRWASGDFSGLPPIEVISAEVLGSALGGYAPSLNKIYLSESFLATANAEQIRAVILEEIGHFVDAQVNSTDTVGDEGELFAAVVLHQNSIAESAENSVSTFPSLLNFQRDFPDLGSYLIGGQVINSQAFQRIKSEDDTAIITINGSLVQIEQSTIPNQVLWSKRVGTDLSGQWGFGNLFGIPNEKTYSKFFGLETSFNPNFFSLPVPGINLGIVGAGADLSLGIAGAKSKSSKYGIKAGLDIKAGYNFGGVKWGLPLFANVQYGINNNQLIFQANSPKPTAFLDWVDPRLFFKATGVLNTDAAIYLDGSLYGEYVDVFKSLFSWKKQVRRKSFDFDAKLNLSTKWSHDFINFDTKNKTQVVDWIFGKKTFTLGGSEKERVDVSTFLNLGLGLPNFSKAKFKPVTVTDPNILRYSLGGSSKLIDLDLDLDDLIGSKLPIPITFKGGQSFNLFGKDIGYKYNFALIDLNLIASLDLNYSINVDIKDILPRYQIENGNGTWRNFDYSELTRSVGDEGTNDATFNYLESLDKDEDGQLEFQTIFDPNLAVSVKAWLTPKLTLKTGLGAYNVELNPFKKFGGYIYDTPDPSISLPSVTLFDQRLATLNFKSAASKLGFDASKLTQPFSIALDPIRKTLGVPLEITLSNGPDYFPGTNESDRVNFGDGPDVGQLSPGFDRLNGAGENSYVEASTLVYKDPYGRKDAQGNDETLLTVNIPNGDIFIIDSDIYSLANGTVRLLPNEDAQAKYFELDLDGKAGVTNGPDTNLRDFERLILSDDVKASSQGIQLDLSTLAGFTGGSRLRPYIGGVPNRNAYSPDAPLSVRHLTTTQGNDYLTMPMGYNDSPYILGDGDDRIDFYGDPPQQTSIPNSFFWSNPTNPFTRKALGFNSEGSFYQDVIDLGQGNNEVFLNANAFYSQTPLQIFIHSVNTGGVNKIYGEFSSLLDDSFYISNFGGSVDLFIYNELFVDSEFSIEGIFSGGGNNIDFQNLEVEVGSNLTFVVDGEGLEHKFGISEIQEVEVEITNSQIFYRTPSADNASSLVLVDTLDPDTQFPLGTLRVTSADFAGDSVQKELGSEERYSLKSPAKQTYIVGKMPAVSGSGNFYGKAIILNGKRVDQIGSYRKAILKNDLNHRVYLDSLFDEVVVQSVDALAKMSHDSGTGFALNTLNLQGIESLNLLYTISNGINIWAEDYVYEIVYSDGSEILGTNAEDGDKPELLTGAFSDSPFAQYAPLITHKLGAGNDLINGDESMYEFFYLGSGNNTLFNPSWKTDSYNYKPGLNAYQPGAVASEAKVVFPFDPTGYYDLNDGTSPPLQVAFGDVVVYTEGRATDYVIQRSSTKLNAIEVIKKDGTKDILYGISLIKFETEDVSAIAVSDSITNPGEIIQVDAFGNDLRSRLFYSNVVRPDGESFKVQLDNNWAIDRVNITQDIIYQPGEIIQRKDTSIIGEVIDTNDDPVIPDTTWEYDPLNPKNTWQYDIPVNIGQSGFTLTKSFLTKEFYDVDISIKNLYTLNDLVVSNLKVTQKVLQGTEAVDVVIPIEVVNGNWLIKSTNLISLDSFPFEISYVIQEPEGYSHFVRLLLSPTDIVNLEDLRSVFQVGLFTNEYNGGPGNDKIDGSGIDEIIRGNGGQNIIYGGGGNDQLFGGDTSDFLSGDAGSDTIYGGAGDDFLDGDGILNIDGVVDPNNANDVIYGGDGNDILLGGIGDDLLIPGKGDDLIEGGDGIDTGVASGASIDYTIRKRLDGSIVVIDRRTANGDGVELYRETEKFQFTDKTLTNDEIVIPEGTTTINADQTQVIVQTPNQNLQLTTLQGSKILSVDLPSLEDLVIDEVLLAKSLDSLQKYRTNQGNRFDRASEILEFLIEPSDPTLGQIIEIKLNQEQDVNTFVKINPSTGETFEFNYNPTTGLGAELLDTNNNGLTDLVRIHLKDGGVGDADGQINGIIYDPGVLAKVNTGPTGIPMDIDGNGKLQRTDYSLLNLYGGFGSDPETMDAILLGFSGRFLGDGALRTTATDISNHIFGFKDLLDIDGNGKLQRTDYSLLNLYGGFGSDPETMDAILSGFSGRFLGDGALRTTATDIIAYVNTNLTSFSF